ncbi:MAG TPA: hypothetical protein QGF58_10140 [Myxococcota bacterium]|nr:hypothetical protein [Myxococcota bacterium]
MKVQRDEVLRIVDRGDHFEPCGLWYENVEERVLRDLRKLLGVLGGEERRPFLCDWVPKDGKLHRRALPLRVQGHAWVWTELSEGVERFVLPMEGCELHCVLEKERTRDRWRFTVVRGEERIELPDPSIEVGPGGPVALEAPTGARIVGDEDELELVLPTLHFVGGAPLPAGAVQGAEVLDGGRVVELSTLETLEDPHVRIWTNLVGEDGPLSSPTVPLSVETSFTGLGPVELPLSKLVLQGVSLRPERLGLVLHHHIGERVDRVEIEGQRAGDAYVLSPAWSPRLAPIGHLSVEVAGQGVLGRVVLEPPPLRARWSHPAAVGAAPAPARVALKPVETTAARWSLGTDGRVRYPETGQEGPVDDLAFEPLAAASAEDLEELVRAGPVEAWLPGRHHIVLNEVDDLDALRLLFRTGETVRIGRGDARGILDPKVFSACELVELEPVGGRFHLVGEGRARIFHRGLLLDGVVRSLGESGQWAFELDSPLAILDLNELGPFWPLRAWNTGGGLRLEGRGRSAHLRVGGELTGDGLQYHFEGFGYDSLLPAERVERTAWRGCLLRGLEFAGWLLDEELVFPTEGPFPGWALSRRGATGVPDDGRPQEVREAVAALMAGTRIAAEVIVETADGAWCLRPRYVHPRKPPVRVDVDAPGGPMDEHEPTVRVWVEA